MIDTVVKEFQLYIWHNIGARQTDGRTDIRHSSCVGRVCALQHSIVR